MPALYDLCIFAASYNFCHAVPISKVSVTFPAEV